MALSFLLPGWFSTDETAEQILAQYVDTADSQYLSRLIAMHGDDLYHYLLRQSDAQLAEDISQQCWLKVIEHRHSYAGHSSFKTWLFNIGRNALLDEFRHRRRWRYQQLQEELVLEADNKTPQFEQQIYQQQQKQRFDELLMQLPFFQREALILQLEGFSLADIAQITAQPQETIKSRLRYARQLLCLDLE